MLPYGRVKYYKKLYNRLLKSTAPGRSDYKLLVGALEKLDRLLATVEGRSSIKVGSQSATASPPPPHKVEAKDEVIFDLRAQRENALPLPPPISDIKESSPSEGSSSSG